MMLTLHGTLINVYESPKGVTKEGKDYGGQNRIQVMAENVLQNGEKKVELVDLTVDDVTNYKSQISKPVRVPVGVYVSAGKLSYYVLKAPQAATAA